MQILRHSRISVTIEIYTEATSTATRDVLKRLGDELGQHDEHRQAYESATGDDGDSSPEVRAASNRR